MLVSSKECKSKKRSPRVLLPCISKEMNRNSHHLRVLPARSEFLSLRIEATAAPGPRCSALRKHEAGFEPELVPRGPQMGMLFFEAQYLLFAVERPPTFGVLFSPKAKCAFGGPGLVPVCGFPATLVVTRTELAVHCWFACFPRVFSEETLVILSRHAADAVNVPGAHPSRRVPLVFSK